MKNKNINAFAFLLSITVAFGLFSCSEDYEPVRGEKADARVKEAMDDYRKMLLEAPDGWKATLSTKSGKDYFYYLKFGEEGTVTMVSDFNETSAGEVMSGTWKLKSLQRPTLSFDTYSYIHLPADPDGNVNGGANGEGLISDFEFAMGETRGDTLILQGIQRGSSMSLLKAGTDEAASVMEGHLKEMLEYVTVTKGMQLVLPGDKKVTLAFSHPAKLLGAQYISHDGTKVETFNSTYIFTTRGIALKNTLEVGGYAINEMLWDKERKVFSVQNEIDVTASEELIIFKPDVPLSSLIGTGYKGFQVPRNTGAYPLPGQSPVFLEKYNEVKEALLVGQYRLTLHEMNYHFDEAAGNLLIDVMVTQNDVLFLAQYRYGYTMDENGVFTFMFQDANQNGWAIQPDMMPLLGYLDTDSFTVEYVGGGFSLIGGMFSEQNPDYALSGYLFEEL